MSIAKKYIQGLKEAYQQVDCLDMWEHFEGIIHGASPKDIEKLKSVYPECPLALLELLQFADGTYHRQYIDETVCFYFFGSDVYEYPYYLLSAMKIHDSQNIAQTYYADYLKRVYEEVEVDERITDQVEGLKWLHFSDCMNNGGTSQLFIDFSPSKKGKSGQVVRFLHDPDSFLVIADSFDEYLQTIIKNGFEFINEDTAE
ncbi:MAG: SMI1/KNR4 family protein [Saezia sp.]